MMPDFPIRTSDIVDDFIASGQPYKKINWQATNRPKESVYVSLLKYLEKYPELGIVCRRIKGEYYLVKQSVSEPSRNDVLSD